MQKKHDNQCIECSFIRWHSCAKVIRRTLNYYLTHWLFNWSLLFLLGYLKELWEPFGTWDFVAVRAGRGKDRWWERWGVGSRTRSACWRWAALQEERTRSPRRWRPGGEEAADLHIGEPNQRWNGKTGTLGQTDPCYFHHLDLHWRRSSPERVGLNLLQYTVRFFTVLASLFDNRCTLTSNGIPKQVPWVNWSPYVTKERLLTLESFDHRDYHQLNIWPIKTSKTRLVISVQYHRSTFVFSIVPTGKFLWVEPVFESAFWAGKRGLEK